MKATPQWEEEQRQSGLLGLIGLVLALMGAALALNAVAGPPHLPASLPDWDRVAFTLRGADLPLEVPAYILTTAAWGVWFWIVGSLALRLLVGIADVATHGAAWVGSLRAVSDRVTLPVIRGLADRAVVALIVLNIVGRAAPSAAAAPLEPITAAAVEMAHHGAHPQHRLDQTEEPDGSEAVQYTVRPNDTLWKIAEHFYGTGTEYPRLVKANIGRVMPDGRRFTAAGVIHPGWVLVVPPASRAIDEVDGQAIYIVEEFDTLQGIAARFLGDDSHWREIFDLNRGTAKLPDGRTLSDPDLIWPGLRLRLPLAPSAPSEQSLAGLEAIPAASGTPPSAAEQPPKQYRGADIPPSTQSQPTAVPTSAAPATAILDAPTASTPTAVGPSPSPHATLPAREPKMAPTPAIALDGSPPPTSDAPSPLVYAAGGLAAAAAAGGAALLARRRLRRSLGEAPIRPSPKTRPHVVSEFAETEIARTLTHEMHGGEPEPAVLVADLARRFLDERELYDVRLLMVRQGRDDTALILSAGIADQSRLIELAGEFGARLGGAGQAWHTPDRDICLQVAGLKLLHLMTPPSTEPDGSPHLLPLGKLSNGRTLYANWRELGHVLLAGLPGGGADVVLTSLIAALAARCRPDELRLWTIADRRALPEQLLRFPHQWGEVVDAEDESGVSSVFEALLAELTRRMQQASRSGTGRWPRGPEDPDIVLVLGELMALPDDGSLELIGTHGPSHGIRVIAATTQPEMLDDAVLAHFDTRLVLQTLDEDQSIQLVGQPEAATLGGGDVLFRIEGRAPVRARGFRVSADHLEQLLQLMQQAYGSYQPRGANRTPMGALDELEVHAERDVRWGEPQLTQGDEAVTDDPGLTPEASREHSEAADVQLETDGVPTPVAELEPGSSNEAISAEELGAPEPTAFEDAHDDKSEGDGSQEQALPATGERRSDEVREATTREQAQEQSTQYSIPPISTNGAAMAGTEGSAPAQTPDRCSLIQVRCFGDFVVRNGDRVITPTGEEGGQYKAWEVLAFLAAHPEGAVSKEKLLTAVWPDIDVDRAANRMRVAMARLRILLARQVPDLSAEVVRADRDGTCRLDTGVIHSDVQRFVALCRAAPQLPPVEAKAAWEEARALYRGDLLNGRGTRTYEWVDERDDSGFSLRERYREDYYQATQALARLYREEGRPNLAVPLYKSLLKAEPTLEDIVRELYECYHELGDLSALIREDHQLRDALRDAYSDPDDPDDDPKHYQPEPETVELFNRIRENLEKRPPSRTSADI